MSKKQQKAPSAAEAAAAQQSAPAANQTAVITLGELEQLGSGKPVNGLDANHTVDLLTGMRVMFHDDPQASERLKIDKNVVEDINRITAIGYVSMMAQTIAIDRTPFAIMMRKTQLEAIKDAAKALDITIDTKALPAPNAEGVIEVPSTAIVVPEEKKDAIKKEREIANAKVEIDPTKIENEKQLKETLLHLMVKGNGTTNLYERISTAINFYKAYLDINANKSDKKEELLKEIGDKSRATLLSEIASMLGPCTFTNSGFAKFMVDATMRSKSPVSAFCSLRDASLNKKTGLPQVDDTVVADIVKVLIEWYVMSEFQAIDQKINSFKKDITALKKDEKNNKKGIENVNKAIKALRDQHDELENVLIIVGNPDGAVIDNFIEDYNNNKSEGFKSARMMASKIAKTYYPGVDLKTVDSAAFVKNLQQYAGVITNMFRSPAQQLVAYKEANITELPVIEQQAEEPKKA